MSEVDFLFFPIRNEQGFKVIDGATYQHMIKTIIQAQIELAKEYPDQKLMVIYPLTEVEGG